MKTQDEYRAYWNSQYQKIKQKQIAAGKKFRRYRFTRKNMVYMDDVNTWRKHNRGDLWSYWKGGD